MQSDLLTTAQAARVLGITRQRVLSLAATSLEFPPSRRSVAGGLGWPRAAVLAWAAAHPSLEPVFTSPENPAGEQPRQVRELMRLASLEAFALNHYWIGVDHLLLGMLHPDCPGSARTVLESFGVRRERLRRALIESLGDPFEMKPEHSLVELATHLAIERANLEATKLADDETASDHVLLALTREWDHEVVGAWLSRCGISSGAVRQRVLDITEGVTTLDQHLVSEPPPEPDPADALDLAPNPLGHDPRRRNPWGSVAFQAPQGRPPRVGMLARQYFVDRDGYPVCTREGQPVHIVVDRHGLPVLNERGMLTYGPVEIPPGCRVAKVGSLAGRCVEGC